LYWWLACLSEPAAALSAFLAMCMSTQYPVHMYRCRL
jgi:hypothetical protein